MIVPTSIDIMLPESTRAGLNTDDQKKAIDYMYGSMLDETKKVNIYDILMSHNDEYLYFRTDHHWTALGAYYAYEEFAKAKGVKPLPLSKYEKVDFPDFLGSFYADTEKIRRWSRIRMWWRLIFRRIPMILPALRATGVFWNGKSCMTLRITAPA